MNIDFVAQWREYAADLRRTGSAYITAANAVGMDANKGRRESAEYLTSEGERLIREANGWENMADETEQAA